MTDPLEAVRGPVLSAAVEMGASVRVLRDSLSGYSCSVRWEGEKILRCGTTAQEAVDAMESLLANRARQGVGPNFKEIK